MQNGVDAKLAFYYSAILNAAAFFGCYAIGYLADSRVGPFNSVVLLAIASGAVAFGWMGAHSNAGMIVWTIVYGFLTGGFQTVFTPCIAHLAPAPELISTWDGMYFLFSPLPLRAQAARMKNKNMEHASLYFHPPHTNTYH